jgi:hypothetical protein
MRWSGWQRAKTLLAARVDASGEARRAGDRGTPEYLARKSGTAPSAARNALETSKRLAALPETRSAVRWGELSRQQAEEIAHTASKNPSSEREMLSTAKRSSLAELRREGARKRAEADPDPEATRRRLHKERFLRRWTDKEGAWNLQARGTPEDGSRFNAVLDPILDQIFHTARREGRREPHEAYGFDALIEMALRQGAGSNQTGNGNGPGHGDGHGRGDAGAPTDNPATTATSRPDPIGDASAAGTGDPAAGNPGGSRTTAGNGAGRAPDPAGASTANVNQPASGTGQPTLVGLSVPPVDDQPRTGADRKPVNPTHLALLRVDLEALVRGSIRDGETCEIAGVGPVSVAAARQLLSESILKLVITRGTDVANITNLGRGPNAAQKVALLWSSPECTVLGCTRQYQQGIQHDHRTPWTQVYETALDNTDRLCHHHHDLKTRFGWALVAGAGKREMVPPDDPRHPDNQPDTSSERAPPPEPPDGAPVDDAA